MARKAAEEDQGRRTRARKERVFAHDAAAVATRCFLVLQGARLPSCTRNVLVHFP